MQLRVVHYSVDLATHMPLSVSICSCLVITMRDKIVV